MSRERDGVAPTLKEALAPIVEELVEGILGRKGPASTWINHTQSPLGRVKTAQLCRSGELKATRVRGTKLWLIRTRDLDDYIAANSLNSLLSANSSAQTAPRDIVGEMDQALAATGKRRRI